jgi:hypothetical protein
MVLFYSSSNHLLLWASNTQLCRPIAYSKRLRRASYNNQLLIATAILGPSNRIDHHSAASTQSTRHGEPCRLLGTVAACIQPTGSSKRCYIPAATTTVIGPISSQSTSCDEPCRLPATTTIACIQPTGCDQRCCIPTTIAAATNPTSA